MAYDKVIDSSVLDANLTSVANAIRSKGGTSASLAFPTGFLDAIAKITTGGSSDVEVYDITIASDLGEPRGGASMPNILTGNAFIKANYNKDNFMAIMFPETPITGGDYVMHFMLHGNRNIGSVGNIRYGTTMLSTSATAIAFGFMDAKISGNGYVLCFRAKDTGNLVLYVANNRTVKAGKYKLILSCLEV